MLKSLRIILLVLLIVGPIIFYKSLTKKNTIGGPIAAFNRREADSRRPKVALIFDDLGESLTELKEIYSLGIPLTISVIPNLKFSKNIAHIGSRCGFSVFIHLPLEPAGKNPYPTNKYRFIGSNLSKREIISILRNYLNSIRIAIGVNNHMGSKATKDSKLMNIILNEIKKRGLIFVDSRTSTESIAYKEAQSRGLICGYNEGFLDSLDSPEDMGKQMNKLVAKATARGRIIVIAHPRANTIKFLKSKLPELRKRIEFVTMKDYFDL